MVPKQSENQNTTIAHSDDLFQSPRECIVSYLHTYTPVHVGISQEYLMNVCITLYVIQEYAPRFFHKVYM